MTKTPFLWTNDDICAGRADKLVRQLQFIDRFNIPGTFFVIPRAEGKNIDDDPELLRVIEKARERGHEFYQHGYVHTPFESGVPETWMLEFSPDVLREYNERRLEIEKQHTFEAMVRMIEAGRKIWRRAFHEDSEGYRPGWGAFCTNLFRALDVLGFQWSSVRLASPTAWLWNNGKWDAPQDFRKEVPPFPHRVGNLIDFSLGTEYAFRVPSEPEKIQAMVDLALRDFDHYHKNGWPMVVCTHWHGLEHKGGTGYAVHEKLLPLMIDAGRAELMGAKALIQWVTEGPGKSLLNHPAD